MSTQFLSSEYVRASIKVLSAFHTFFGTTFLVLKKCQAPVGSSVRITLDAENHSHLSRYFRLDPRSSYFFTPFSAPATKGRWREPRYASTSLQAINTQAFSGALVHPRNQPEWGWSFDYLPFLASKLPRGRRVPLLALAAWILREEQWLSELPGSQIIDRLLTIFPISEQEINVLFTREVPLELNVPMFSEAPALWKQITAGYGVAPDIPLDRGATLRFLAFRGLGPAEGVTASLGERLNLLTGDNGLGKTFFLDVAWWALTREWVDQPIHPDDAKGPPPNIRFTVSGSADDEPLKADFDQRTQAWMAPGPRSMSGLAIYARVDGSFAIWDPLSQQSGARGSSSATKSSLIFSRDEIWTGDSKSRIEGLLRDWVSWQNKGGATGPYDTFLRVVERTRPPDAGRFEVGIPTRLMGYSMEIPTLLHPYGTVPVTRESAGIKRILSLAYLIVWAWEEHKFVAKELGRKQEKQLVILLDEAEAHLHPRWQRVLIPALLGIAEDLQGGLEIQFIVATHSPMVLASTEQVWDLDKDVLFNLKMMPNGKVVFESVPYSLKGTADAWLKSDSFGELYPGSVESEIAIKRAKALMDVRSPDSELISRVNEELASSLAPTDAFWTRWIVFASAYGVDP